MKNSLAWNNGNFPIINYLIDKKDNAWYRTLDNIYSMFKIDDKFYVSGIKWSKSTMGFAMAFGNDDSVPVKNGFESGEQIYWGVLKEDGVHELTLVSTYQGILDINAIFELTDNILDVNDNPYYSLDMVWPRITELKVNKPVTNKALTMSQFIAYKPLMPQYHGGGLTPEIVEGKVTLKVVPKYFNSCTIRFTKEAVDKGYILLKIKANPLPNSNSTITEKTYKIYW